MTLSRLMELYQAEQQGKKIIHMSNIILLIISIIIVAYCILWYVGEKIDIFKLP